MEALGRVFNVLPVADDVYINLRDTGGVTFVCVNAAGETLTLTEATSAGGGSAAVLTTIERVHVSATVGAVWALVTQAAASTFVASSSQDVVVLEVDPIELSDGFSHVKVASTSTGTVFAITHDLHVQRKPANLPAMV